MKGKVITLKRENGYGFLRLEGMTDNVFFHVHDTDIEVFDSLERYDQVTCEIGTCEKGIKAVNIKKVGN